MQKKITVKSNIKINLRCPDCKQEQEKWVDHLTNLGFSCIKCNDGISIPNKFVFNLLSQLDIRFTTEKIFTNKLRYDFFIIDEKITIEAHGSQHYINNPRDNYRDLKFEQENDKLKRIYSESLGNKHIEINCINSQFNYLKQQVEKSLGDIFDLSHINWEKIYKECLNSLLIKSCNMWNKGNSIVSIAKILKLSTCTIREYLKTGHSLNLCHYTSKEQMVLSGRKNLKRENTKKVVFKFDINNKLLEIFDSILSASKSMNVSTDTMSNYCKFEKFAKGFLWKFKK